MKQIIAIILFVGLFSGCSNNSEKREPKVAFYYWKTVFKVTENEKKVLSDNNVGKLYIRYFDIGLKGKEAVPVSPIGFSEKPDPYKVVPVVYIKNEVMLEPTVDLEKLAENVNTYIGKVNTQYGIAWDEIQVDCDWTLNSKDRYLKFVEQLKSVSAKRLSATIRLHQVKYFNKTGIPNVDKGVLMYYNMGSIAPDNRNSIYDREVAQSYIKSLKKFPLALDVALPIYSWGIHIRNHRVIKVISKIDVAALENDPHFKRTDGMYFTVVESVIRGGNYFKEGDQLKMESISKDDLENMADDLRDNLANRPDEIIFYDLDDFNMTSYNSDQKIFKKVAAWF
ncbi:hypothetical protein [Flavobacterium sp. CAU 1735]|uniref:hypothetical protein n=1 Tax=Flavobacterium sp. CAU 1735 TaxID=3140361 RepID=UPI003261CCF3